MPNITPEQYIALIKESFQENGVPEDAVQKVRYMKNHFDFYGLRAKIWVGLLKELFVEYGIYEGKDLEYFIQRCFDDEYREIHYAAIQMFERQQKKSDHDYIDLLEWMVVHQSWWDSVDWISKLIGIQFKKHPEQIIPYTQKWIKGDNMWLQRVAIIFQSAYKEQTDQELLFDYCKQKAFDKEFFIRKAIGWALRQYSRTNPQAVKAFVIENQNQLSTLSKREALRLMD